MTPKASAAVTVVQNNIAESSLKKGEGAAPVVPCKRTRAIAELDPNLTPQVDVQALKIEESSKVSRKETSKLENQ